MDLDNLLHVDTFKHYDHLKPLYDFAKRKYGFTFFYYERRLDGKVKVALGSDRQWATRYIEEYEHVDSFFQEKITDTFSYYVWGQNPRCKKEAAMHEERTKIFGIPPGITISKKAGQYIDTFSVSTNLYDGDVINYLITNINNVEEYSEFFVKEIEDLLKEKRLIFIPSELEKVYLTAKETEILKMMIDGYKLPEIANKIFKSPRTIQAHIDNAKISLGCRTREQLIAKVVRENLLRDKIIIKQGVPVCKS